MPKKYWDDFEIGETTITDSITVTETHLVNWAGLTMDFYPLHMDEEFAKKTQFGKRIAHGPLIFAMAVGLMAKSNIFQDSIIAWVGVENMRIPLPTFIGDTIHVEATLNKKQEAKKADRGIVDFLYCIKNQNEKTVMALNFLLLMHRKTEG